MSKAGKGLGNMHYGTVGTFLFKPKTLYAAVGIYQIYSGTCQLDWYATYFDEPKDQLYIRKGINLHGLYNFPTIDHYQH